MTPCSFASRVVLSRKSFQSLSVKARFTLTGDTEVKKSVHTCFYVTNGSGQRLDLAARSDDMRSSWMESLGNNVAWVANLETTLREQTDNSMTAAVRTHVWY